MAVGGGWVGVLRTRAWRRWTAWSTTLGIAAAGLVAIPVAAVATAPGAVAATVPITVTAQVLQHHGLAGTDAANCIKYLPLLTSTSSTFVGSGAEAITAHGYPSGSTCPAALTTAIQSAVGVRPAATSSATDGVPFLLSSVTHYNNPITSGVAARYTGQLNVRLGGFDGNPVMTFDWTMWETPNNADPCAFPTGPNQNGCADQITFTAAVANQTITRNGVSYKLVITGFAAQSGGVCPSAPPTGVAPSADFLTAEGLTSTSCLYASVNQVRSLTVVKKAIAPTGLALPAFAYSAQSTLTGSPWAGTTFSLTPPAQPADRRTAELLQGESVTITEGLPTGDQWAVTSIACVDGDGTPMSGVTSDVATGRLTLTNVGAPPTTTAGPVTCTYTNTYTPKGTLTLRKTVTGGTATVADFTLVANGPTPLTGVSGTAAVTDRRVTAGSYALSEVSGVGGYVPGAWSCTGGTLTGSTVAVADGAAVVCTIDNRFATGTLRITKTIADPAGGFAGTASTPFSGTYVCGTAAPVGFTVSTGTAYLSPPLPAGQVCTVTETPPTGTLKDTSYSWGTPTYAGNGATVADGATATVAITNPISRATGALALDKVVQPRSGVLATGYTGGTTRPFPVAYVCTIGTTVVASGTVTVRPDGTQTQVSGIPATASCTLTETQAPLAGDFADGSYRWDGLAWTANPVTIAANATSVSTVTNFFARDFATLRLTKAVVGGGYVGTGAVFSVQWSCAGSGGTVLLADGGATTVAVPANSLCSVTETAPSDTLLAPSHDWGPARYTGLTDGTVSIPPNQTATVGVENPTVPVYGRVAVEKLLTPATLSTGVRAGALFTVQVSCTAPAEGQTTPYAATLALPVGASQTTPNLPVGTSCTLTESAPTPALLVDDSYRWGPTPGAQTVTVDTKDGVVTATVTNTLQRAYGTLGIVKAVDNPFGTLPADQTGATVFSGTWTCQYADQTPLTGTWSRTGPGAASLTGPTDQILLGSTCAMTEGTPSPSRPSSDTSYRWGAPALPAPVTLSGADPQGLLRVVDPVVRVTGGFAVAKVVLGGVEGTQFQPGPFAFSYSCLPQGGGAALRGTLQVRDGQTVAVDPSLPAGAVCTVTEDTGAFPAPIDPYVWRPAQTEISVTGRDPVTAATIDFTLPDDGSGVVVRVVNVIQEQTFTVTARKAVDGATAGFTGAATATFDLSLVCTSYGRTQTFGPYAARVGQAVSIPSVPLGSDCQVAEGAVPAGLGLADDSYRWVAATAADRRVVTGPSEFVVTNTVERVRGALALSKVLVDPTAAVDPGRVFSGTFACVHAPDAPVTGTWTVTGAGEATLSYDVPGSAPFLASQCTPTEGPLSAPSADPSYSWSADTPSLAPATVTAEATARMVVTNTVQRATATLRVSKTLSGQTQGYVGTGAQFTVAYSCFLADPSQAVEGQVVIPAGAPAQTLATGIPVGWTCRVAESTPASSLLRNASYAWDLPTISGLTDGQLVVAADVELVVDNPVLRRTGTVFVEKALGADTPATALVAGAAFTGTYSCSYAPGQPDAQTQTGTWSVTGTGPATLSPTVDLPIGTVCEVAEDAPTQAQLVDGSWRWRPGSPTISPPVTVEGATGAPTILVTNAADRVYSSMTVTKLFRGVPGAFPAGTTVSGVWSCTSQGAVVAAGQWSADAAGGSDELFRADGSIAGPGGPYLVPAGATCEVLEQALDDSLLTDPSYAWEPESYDPPSRQVVTVDGQSVDVTVVNSVRRVTAPFAVRKAVTAPDGVTVDPDVRYTGGFVCTKAGDPDYAGTWSVVGEGTTTIQGALVGATCVLDGEAPAGRLPVAGDESYKWGEPVFSPPGGVLVAADPLAELLVTNRVERLTTDLQIRKVVTGDVAALPADTAYDVSFSCTAQDGTSTLTGAGTVVDGATWSTPASIPIGSTCTVTEGPRPDPAPRAAWGPVTFAVADILDNPVTVAGQSATFQIPGGDADRVVAHPVVTVTNPLQRLPADYTITKTSDPPSGTLLRPGDEVTYTVTVTPTGVGVVEDVVVTDDLSQVLPYAALAPVTPSVGTLAQQGTSLIWSVGRLVAPTPVSLSYTVRVNPDAWAATLRNAVVGQGEKPPLGCPPLRLGGGGRLAPVEVPSCQTTEHPVVPAWTITKSADPASGTLVAPGSSVTYSLTVTNLSAVAALGPVTATDDLSGVLTYADLVAIGPAPVGTAAVVGPTLTWQVPAVPTGASVTVTYTVTVKADAAGARIHNVVTGTGTDDGGGGSTPPPSPCPTCTTETEHPISATWTLRKSADPLSGTSVRPGEIVRYTLEVTSRSRSPFADLVVVDDLSQVLAHAALGTLDAPEGTSAAVSGTTLTWTIPSLPAGVTLTLSYPVTVDADAAGVTLRNVVTGTGATPPDQCLSCSTEHPVPAVELPRTGVGPHVPAIGLAGLLLLLLGAGLLLARRRLPVGR